MRTSAIPSPAVCQLPVIEASHSTGEAGANGMNGHSRGFLARIGAKAWAGIISRVPVGIEGGSAFHGGVPGLVGGGLNADGRGLNSPDFASLCG
jgi:hypothetical protein